VAKAIKSSEKNKAEPYLAKRFRAAADFKGAEIHYFWPSQILRAPKYTISGRRGFAALEIHYFWLSQVLQCPKYTISGRRRFYNARNTLFLAAADLQQPKTHSDGLSTG